jgi:C-terminal processing protease CtpA/Prc
MPLTRRAALGLWLPLVVSGCGRPRASTPGTHVPEPPSPARERPTTATENLVAFARLYGYVRFFHPSDASADADWRKLAAHGVSHLRGVETLGACSDALQRFFAPVAPSLQQWVAPEDPPDPPAPPGKRDGPIFWQYLGYPGTHFSLHKPPYAKSRVGASPKERRRFPEAPPLDARIEGELLPDLHVRLPIVLDPERAAATQARDEPFDPELSAQALGVRGHERLEVRLGTVIEVWNVLRHFYPYQADVQIDWDGELVAALEDAERATDLDAMVATVWRLVHALKDGHGWVGHARLPTPRGLPFQVEVIEGKAVVTATSEPERVKLGDVVETIGDETALDRIARWEGRLSGSDQWRRFRAAAWEASSGPSGASERVVISRGGKRLTLEATYSRRDPLVPPRPDPIDILSDGVMYVDLTRASWPNLEVALADLSVAPGVVFDMRGYPSDTHRILSHLLPSPEDALWMHVPRVVEPDGRVVAYQDLGWHMRPKWPPIQGAVAFLISPAAISYGESLLSYVEAHRLGTLVGEAPTAGANGDVVRLDSLAGFFVLFTGMRVTRHDGGPFHLRGIAPQIRVTRTIAGLRAGRDEELEVALADVRRRRPAGPLELPPPPAPDPELEPLPEGEDGQTG